MILKPSFLSKWASLSWKFVCSNDRCLYIDKLTSYSMYEYQIVGLKASIKQSISVNRILYNNFIPRTSIFPDKLFWTRLREMRFATKVANLNTREQVQNKQKHIFFRSIFNSCSSSEKIKSDPRKVIPGKINDFTVIM